MSPQPARSQPKSRRILWIGLPALIAAAAGTLWHLRIPPLEAVIVRPLADGTGQPWLAGAITEEIAEALRPVTKANADPKLTAVLEGAVKRDGDWLRITATLSRPDGHRYWTKTFGGPAGEVAVDVAAEIIPRIRKKRVRHKTAAGAYEKYLEARQQFGARDFTNAVAGFDRAVASDPTFGLAWAWVAISREHLADRGAGRPNDLLPSARDAAERAVTLEPDLAESHTALGIVKLQYDWDWDGARRELDRALELNPGDPLAMRWRGRWQEVMNGDPAVLDLPAVVRDPDSARRLLAEADEIREYGYIPAAALVLAATVARDTESLFRWLEAAYDERSAQLPYLLRNPALPLSDPRVVALVRPLKQPTHPRTKPYDPQHLPTLAWRSSTSTEASP
jgi:tetratricopeptide (TPR) repeat protein